MEVVTVRCGKLRECGVQSVNFPAVLLAHWEVGREEATIGAEERNDAMHRIDHHWVLIPLFADTRQIANLHVRVRQLR